MPAIPSNAYSITNIKYGTVMDVSAYDHMSVIGFPDHNGFNQRWILISVGDYWVIRSVSPFCTGFVGFDGSPEEGKQVIMQSSPIKWTISTDTKTGLHRFIVPGTPLQATQASVAESTLAGVPVLLKNAALLPEQDWDFTSVHVLGRLGLGHREFRGDKSVRLEEGA